MSLRKHVGTRRLVTFGIALAAAVLFLAWTSAGTQVAAQNVQVDPALNFSMTAVGEEGCDTTGGDTKCYIEPGSTFTLEVSLDSMPEAADSYEGFDIVLNYAGLTVVEDSADPEAWPDCGFPATFYDAGLVAMSCAIGIESGPSTHLGVIGTAEFTCSASGSITMPFGVGNTILQVDVATPVTEDAPETLTINCGERPTPTEEPEATATAAPALPVTGMPGGTSDDGADAALWALIGALLTVGVAGVAVFGLRYARSR